MTIQDCINVGQSAAPYAAAVAGGYLLKFFNVLSVVGAFFKRNPALGQDALTILRDLRNGQNALADILKALADAQGAQALAGAPKDVAKVN